MKWLERLASALTPKRWPVRWRLAAVSAVLTFLILVIFAFVVGRLTSSRLHSDFNQDVSETASTIATRKCRGNSGGSASSSSSAW